MPTVYAEPQLPPPLLLPPDEADPSPHGASDAGQPVSRKIFCLLQIRSPRPRHWWPVLPGRLPKPLATCQTCRRSIAGWLQASLLCFETDRGSA